MSEQTYIFGFRSRIPAPLGTPENGIDARFSDIRRIKGSGNVFLDLGFDPAEARVMALRAEVMIRVGQQLKAKGWMDPLASGQAPGQTTPSH